MSDGKEEQRRAWALLWDRLLQINDEESIAMQTTERNSKSLNEKASRDHETQWIRARELGIAPEYQRELRREKVRRFRDAWDGRACGSLVVNRRVDGSCWVIDGQHRLLAFAERFGLDGKLPCTVLHGLSAVEEAKLFAQINGDRSMTTRPQNFRAKAFGHDEAAMDIQRIAHAAGIQLRGIDAHGDYPVSTNAIGTMEAVYQRGGVNLLARTLGLARETWPDDKHGVEAWMIGGIARFIEDYDQEFDPNVFIRKLASTTPAAIKGHASALKSTVGYARENAVRETLVTLYNKNRRTNTLAPHGNGRR